MTTHLTNTFTSARLLAAAMTSILLLGILAPTAYSGTSDGLLNLSNTPLIGPQPTITTFDAPGAGTGPGQGTLPFAINPAGMVLGYYIDARVMVFCALGTAPSPHSTLRARGQVPAKAQTRSASPRQA
jgi:hypothetical protein